MEQLSIKYDVLSIHDYKSLTTEDNIVFEDALPQTFTVPKGTDLIIFAKRKVK